MPLNRLTKAERALGAALLAIGSAGCVAGLLAVAGYGADLGTAGPGVLLAVGVGGMLGGVEPRRHRPMAWPVVAALLGLGVGGVLREEWAVGALSSAAGVGVLVLLVFAVRSVNGAWFRGGPPSA